MAVRGVLLVPKRETFGLPVELFYNLGQERVGLSEGGVAGRRYRNTDCVRFSTDAPQDRDVRPKARVPPQSYKIIMSDKWTNGKGRRTISRHGVGSSFAFSKNVFGFQTKDTNTS